MKNKSMIWIGLTLQITFLLFMLFAAPEPHGAIEVGLEKMQAACPAEGPTGKRTADGNWVLSTAGDFFKAADSRHKQMVNVTISFTLASIAISGLLLFTLRKKRE